MEAKTKYSVIGLMSGTSLDGIDLACCEFEQVGKELKWELKAAETTPYAEEWVDRLSTLENSTAFEYALADIELGHLMGQRVAEFVARTGVTADFVASHGHTIFHQPKLKLTTQIGNGDAIAAECGLPVIHNFRTFDVALGGQGAPLVPIGDRLLFSDYDACLNLGGFANISYEAAGKRTAFDVSPCNMAMNFLARKMGADYDKDGLTARSGNIIPTILEQLNGLPYYSQSGPKSLGKEWFVSSVLPLIDNEDYSVSDLMRTFVEHIAQQVAAIAKPIAAKSLLATGGGARNKFLIERIGALAEGTSVAVPDDDIIDYKEAIIFALLGYLRITQQTNTLRSVTGAKCDSIGGNISGIALPLK